MHGKTDMADYMVIASGTSSRHASFLADKLSQNIREVDPNAVASIEGAEDGNWVLLDAGDIIVHIFRPEYRELYNLEKMWAVKIPEMA